MLMQLTLFGNTLKNELSKIMNERLVVAEIEGESVGECGGENIWRDIERERFSKTKNRQENK